MDHLSNEQKKIIKKICDIQLATSIHIFQNEQSPEGNLKNSNLDISQEVFYNSLLDTTNFFKKLKDQNELIFDIDQADARIAIHIIKYAFEDNILKNIELKNLIKFLLKKGETHTHNRSLSN